MRHGVVLCCMIAYTAYLLPDYSISITPLHYRNWNCMYFIQINYCVAPKIAMQLPRFIYEKNNSIYSLHLFQ